MDRTIDYFTTENGSYSVQKTIMNRLIPIGKTLDFIKEDRIIENDIKLEENSSKVKKLITDYHKVFIENNLNINMDFSDLYNLYKKYNYETDREKKYELNNEIRKLQNEKRTEIINTFKKNKDFNKLFSKEIIEELIPEIADEEEKNLLASFKGFTTYFSAFNESKKKIYETEEKHNTIAYRIVNENFDIFTYNSFIINKLDKELLNFVYEEIKDKISDFKIENIYDPKCFHLFFNQKGIDLYNLIIGGYSEENIKHKGLNEIINEKSEKKFKLKKMQKMILSDSESFSFSYSSITDNNELISELEIFGKEKNILIKNIEDIFSKYNSFDLSKVFISYKKITELSLIIFGKYNILSDSLKLKFRKENKDIKSKSKYEKLEKVYLQQEYFNFKELQDAFELYAEENSYSITDIKLLKTFFIHNSYANLSDKYNRLESYMCSWKEKNTELIQNDKAITLIKDYLDLYLETYNYFKIIEYKGISVYEPELYDEYSVFFEQMKDIVSLYNRTRNYLTKKITATKKIPLNLNISTFSSGWDYEYISNKNYTFILRKNDKYYLGILNRQAKIDIVKFTEHENDTDSYELMFFKQFKDPNKMLPKILFAKSNKELFNPSEDFIRKYKDGMHLKSSPNFNLDFCHEYIDFCKDCLSKYNSTKLLDMKFSDTSSYSNVSDFYKEIENQNQKIWFENISSQFIDSNVESGNIYLFEIYNKRMKNENKDSQTLMFNYIFSKENLEDMKIKLQKGSIFYRPAKIKPENTIIHKAGSILVNKTDKNGKHIEDELYKEIYLYLNHRINSISKEAQELLDGNLISYHTAKYDITKNKRFTEDSFILHLSIKMNKNSQLENQMYFNERILEKIANDKNVNIMGINRGERNLIYITIINQEGKVLKTESLNIINSKRSDGKIIQTNYLSKLKDKSSARNKERENWLEIENIKELKEGYLSQAISKIAELMIEYNAVVVLEKLDKSFKNNRTAIEFSIYEKFEKMLINKLNCLIIHNKKPYEKGGILNPYQLTSKFDSLDNIYVQCGWLFFLNAAYISKIDPDSNFVNLFNTNGLTNFKKKKDFLSKFNSIKYDEKINAFKFSFSYSNFEISHPINEWELFTNNDRTYFDKEKKKYVTVNLNEELISCLEGTIFYKTELIDFIRNCPDERKYYPIIDSLFRIFSLTVKMNNYNNSNEYFISPVQKNDSFFDSRKNSELQTVDAVSSYNLAFKMNYFFKNGFKNEKNKMKFLTNEEWFNYLNS